MRAGRLSLPAALAFLVLPLFGPSAAAAPPEELWTSCAEEAQPLDLECRNPRGVGVSRDNGRVYVSDQLPHRVNEFTPLGDLARSWGWDVVVGGGTGFEVCVPEEGDVCKEGTTGAGAGQMPAPQGIAVDSEGAVYVVDITNFRVQKFDSEGNFALMFGGEVNQGGGTPESPGDRCTATHLENGDACGKGSEGTGPGEFGGWRPSGFTVGSFIAIGSDDKVYVGDNQRIQVFDTAGAYQEEIALPGHAVQSLAVDDSGNLYAIYRNELDVRKISPAGVEQASPRFVLKDPNEDPVQPTAVAVDAEGNVYAFGPVSFGGGSSVPMDPIFKFDAAGNETENFGKGEFNASTGIAANTCEGSESPGNLFVSNFSTTNGFLRAYGSVPIGCFRPRTLPATEITETAATLNGTLNPKGGEVSECFFEWGETEAYGQIAQCDPEATEIGEGSDPVPVEAELEDLEKGTVHHFRLVATVDGETEAGADLTFKTLGPPTIGEARAVGATSTEATVKANVNPEGFETTFQIEYGPTEAYGQSTPALPVGSDRSEHPVTETLTGLDPGTTYHWRVVATNSSGTTLGEDREVTTYLPFSLAPCPNDALRPGAAASLPDCRAYEMVSPVDKNGGDIIAGRGIDGGPGGYMQARPDGDKLTYTSLASFAGQPSTVNFNQYIATRGGSGWSSAGINRPILGDAADPVGFGLMREYSAFSADLCSGWLFDNQTPPLRADAQPELRNLYRRENCASGPAAFEPPYAGLETLTETPPALEASETGESYVDQNSVQGVTEDGAQALFTARAALGVAADSVAPAEGNQAQLYLRSGGENRLASVLPAGGASGSAAAAGSSAFRGNLQGAFATDGSVAYWSGSFTGSTGRLFARLNPAAPQSAFEGGSATGTGALLSGVTLVQQVKTATGAFAVGQRISGPGIALGTTIEAVGPETLTLSKAPTSSGLGAPLEAFGECSEAAKACTLPVSEGNSAFFWAGASDGSKAIYTEGDHLHEFDLEAAKEGDASRRHIAGEVMGVAGASEDLGRIYVISREALTAGGEAGEPNLYLENGAGNWEHVGVLAEGDVGEVEPGATRRAYNLAARNPNERAARVSADGAVIAFNSRAQLTEYENRDVQSGVAAVEVYRYQAGEGLACASCDPSGARPQTRKMPHPYSRLAVEGSPSDVSAAAWIPTWEHPLHASNALSADGERLFFNSNDDLVPADQNGAPDVYEWEAAGTGSCTAASPSFFEDNGGCVYLISTGQSSYESEFWEADRDGSDVFFTTLSSLAPQDPGSVDLYDARVGGGYPEPSEPAECEGEACQDPPPAPSYDVPSSEGFAGPPNPRPNSCAAHARRAKQLSRRAKRLRRAARRTSRKAAKRRRAGKAKRLSRRARGQSNKAKRCRAQRKGGTVR